MFKGNELKGHVELYKFYSTHIMYVILTWKHWTCSFAKEPRANKEQRDVKKSFCSICANTKEYTGKKSARDF